MAEPFYTCCEDGMMSQVPPTDRSGLCPACKPAAECPNCYDGGQCDACAAQVVALPLRPPVIGYIAKGTDLHLQEPGGWARLQRDPSPLFCIPVYGTVGVSEVDHQTVPPSPTPMTPEGGKQQQKGGA